MPGSEGLSRYRVTRLPDKMSIYKMFKLTYLVSTSFPQSSVQGCEAFFPSRVLQLGRVADPG